MLSTLLRHSAKLAQLRAARGAHASAWASAPLASRTSAAPARAISYASAATEPLEVVEFDQYKANTVSLIGTVIRIDEPRMFATGNTKVRPLLGRRICASARRWCGSELRLRATRRGHYWQDWCLDSTPPTPPVLSVRDEP
jgi:hypothetical protein